MPAITSPHLMTRLGALSLPNPLICGAGEHVMTVAGIRAALATGVAGVIAKSTNEAAAAAAQLDYTDYTMLRADGGVSGWPDSAAQVSLEHSFFGRSGLIQRAAEEWFADLAVLDAEAQRAAQFVAASVVLADAGAAVDLARLANDKGLRVFEFNIGAPHGKEAARGAITLETDPARLQQTVQQLTTVFKGTVWVKLSGMGDNVVALARAAHDGGAATVGLTGRFMGFMPDLDTMRPVLGTSAAYGGRWAVPITCRWLAMVRRELGGNYPLIGTNGARSGADLARFILAGASAVQMTSVVFQQGFGALRLALDELSQWLQAKDLQVLDVIGKAADALQGYTQQASRPQHWRKFVPPETRS